MDEEGKPPLYEPKGTPLGAARFATDEDIITHDLYNQTSKKSLATKNIFLAKIPPPPIRYSHLLPYYLSKFTKLIEMDASKGHLLTVAPSGSGKGAQAVIPNLLSYEGSIVVLDVKGENAAISAKRRKTFGDVAILNPWGVLGMESIKFNPLDVMKNQDIATQVDDAGMMASMLVYDEKAGDTDHWVSSAKALVKALILFVVNYDEESARKEMELNFQEALGEEIRGLKGEENAEPIKLDIEQVVPEFVIEENRTLNKVYALLCQNEAQLSILFEAMTNFKKIDVVQHQGAAMLAKEDREKSGIISTAITQLEFLSSHNLVETMKETSQGFDLKKLKQEVLSLYLVIPPDKIPAYFKWMRLMVNCSLVVSQRTERIEKKDLPNVLFLLDEFATLGRIEEIAKGLGLLRGYNITLWPILQDLSQLRHHYGELWQTFISNAYILQVFGTADIFTAEYISKIGGQTSQHYMTSK